MKVFFKLARISSGLYIAYLFIAGFMGKFAWFIGFNEARELLFSPENVYFARAKFGIFVIYTMAIGSVLFIVIPKEWHLNIIGFFLALATFVVLLAF